MTLMSIFQTRDGESMKPMSLFKILKYNSSEFWTILIGCVGSACYGACAFIYGIAVGAMFQVPLLIVLLHT